MDGGKTEMVCDVFTKSVAIIKPKKAKPIPIAVITIVACAGKCVVCRPPLCSKVLGMYYADRQESRLSTRARRPPPQDNGITCRVS